MDTATPVDTEVVDDQNKTTQRRVAPSISVNPNAVAVIQSRVFWIFLGVIGTIVYQEWREYAQKKGSKGGSFL